MKFRFIALFFVIIPGLFSGCQPSSAATGKISFMVFGDAAELAAYQKLVDSFEQKFPDVHQVFQDGWVANMDLILF